MPERARQRQEAYAAQQGNYAPRPPRRILLIEDSKSDVVLIKRMLKDAAQGNNAFAFTDVARMDDALDILDHESFDLILLDLQLRDVEGVAAVAALHAEMGKTPIIVYSGAHDPALRESALMCGARHFLVKGRESPFAFKFMVQETLT